MSLPISLRNAITEQVQSVSTRDLIKASAELSYRYRNRTEDSALQKFMPDKIHRIAYAATRMPATYAVVARVLQEIKIRKPDLAIRNLLDVGAGPGTAMWAAIETFNELDKITLIEQDPGLIELGSAMARCSDQPAVKSASWNCNNVITLENFPPHDLIILSYMIGELLEEQIPSLMQKCLNAAVKALVVIEPGTKRGFENIRIARSHLLSLGAHMLAPCPHANACPMTGNDWCHFSERIERMREHQMVKEAYRGYEDEKYSYVVVSKEPIQLPQARLLSHPQKRSGHVNLKLCTLEGLEDKTISRRDGNLYKEARKLSWGDSLPEINC
jgi:ribosomal protein RSM22 (predicted rRNA methylase)